MLCMTPVLSNTSFPYVFKPAENFLNSIMFYVRVPVLSEQIHEVDPRVSTDSIFLTSTNLPAILLAVKARDTVTVARSPSGTLATMIPMAKTRFLTGSKPADNPKQKKEIPRMKATAEMMKMNLSISVDSGVCFLSAD